jgi:hypothetical protein
MVFTGFGGASTGTFEFYKEQISSTGVEENDSPVLLSAYPNPASDMIQLTLFVENPTKDDIMLITDMRGVVVLQTSLEKQSGLFTQTVSVDNLSSGIYNIRVITGGKASDQRISIIK